MQILYDRIRKDGIVRAGNVLKVDRFLNHQMDIHLFQEISKEFKRLKGRLLKERNHDFYHGPGR